MVSCLWYKRMKKVLKNKKKGKNLEVSLYFTNFARDFFE